MANENLVRNPDGGYEFTRGAGASQVGTVALDGSNPTPVTTELTAIDAVQLTLVGSSAPGVSTSTLTYTVSGGVISIYAWKPTSNSDPTLVASTGTETVSWRATGR